MKLIIISFALLSSLTTNPDLGTKTEVDQMVNDLIAYYGWENEQVLDLDQPTSIEVYDQEGNLLLKSDNIEADLRLLDHAQIQLYRTAEFIMQSSETEIYMAH